MRCAARRRASHDGRNRSRRFSCSNPPRHATRVMLWTRRLLRQMGLRYDRDQIMAYTFIVLVASIALTAVYVFATEASYWSKGLVVGLLLLSFAWRYGLFLR